MDKRKFDKGSKEQCYAEWTSVLRFGSSVPKRRTDVPQIVVGRALIRQLQRGFRPPIRQKEKEEERRRKKKSEGKFFKSDNAEEWSLG